MIKFPMTAAGYSALENELKHRVRVERARLIQRIQEAIADDSNLAENSEYQAAKTDQEINEARIAELEDKLARAEVIDVSKLSGDIIKFGATVTLIDKDTGNKKVWQTVGEPEADANKGRISVTSHKLRCSLRIWSDTGKREKMRRWRRSGQSRPLWPRPVGGPSSLACRHIQPIAAAQQIASA
jgi:transcription elongation factor GreA